MRWLTAPLVVLAMLAALPATALASQTLTVEKQGSGTGTVTSSPAGINCPGDCAESYLSKTAITLTATPAPGSEFAHWSGGGCSGTGACKVLMNEARNVTATFTKNSSPSANKCHVPKGKKGKLVVRYSKPGAGATRKAGTKVYVKLARAVKGKR